MRLVHDAPNPLAAMAEMIERLKPLTWRGSRSTILEVAASFLDEFETLGNSALAAFINVQKEELRKEAGADLRWETNLHKGHDERFE